MVFELVPIAAAVSLTIFAVRLAASFVQSRRDPPKLGAGGEDGDDAPRSRVIGLELARAEEAERRRLASGPVGVSPMPAETYGRFDLYEPVPLALDDALATIARRFAAGDAAAREAMRRSISMDEIYTLLSFVRRTAVLGMRERSMARARDAMAAVAMIELERVDPRDLKMALGFAHRAAARAGGDADALLAEAAALADPGTAALIRGFVPDEGREVGFLVEVDTPGGPGFLPTGFHPYHPTRDLIGAARGVAALLNADRYEGSVSIASFLPERWLRDAAGPAVDRARAGIRAGADVHAFLRPEAGSPDEFHTLVAFLVETADEADARTLLDASRRVRSADYALLGAADGPLFCLLVATSALKDVKPIETPESLARFEDGLARVLADHAHPV